MLSGKISEDKRARIKDKYLGICPIKSAFYPWVLALSTMLHKGFRNKEV